MANYEYSSYSASSSTGDAAGAGGAGNFDVAKAIFNQADTNRDGSIDRNEFTQWASRASGAGAGAGGVSGQFDYGAAGAVGGGNFESSYESSSFSTTGGAVGVDAGISGVSSFESSTVGLEGGVAGDANFGASSFESSSSTVTGAAGFDATAISQAASYTAETNAAWSRYGAEVTGAGLYVDSNPQIIRRPAAGGIQTYTQNIRVRFLQPPPIPPPGVSEYIIIRIFSN